MRRAVERELCRPWSRLELDAASSRALVTHCGGSSIGDHVPALDFSSVAPVRCVPALTSKCLGLKYMGIYVTTARERKNAFVAPSHKKNSNRGNGLTTSFNTVVGTVVVTDIRN